MKATVLVRPKDGILDPQGEAVRGSLRKLGFDVERHPRRARDRRRARAPTTPFAREQVERMCSELLANPLIESVEIRLDGE